MQSPPLPIQLTSPAPANANANARKQNGPADGALQFSAALSREMGQHASAPAAQAKQPAAPAPRAAAPKQAEKQADKQAQAEQPAKADAPDTAAAPASRADAGDSAKTDAGDADSAAQAAANPMLDLMALVASFNQPIAAAPAAAAAVAATAAADAATVAAGQRSLTELPPEISLQLPLAAAARLAGQAAPAGPAVKAAPEGTPAADGALEGAFANMMGKVDGAMQDGLEAAAAKLALPAAPALPQARALAAEPLATDKPGVAPAAVGTAAPVQLAATVQREAAPELPVVKDAPVAAVAATPLQQAAFAPLQAAAAVHGADRIAARVGTPGWDNQVAQKIVWMVAGKEQSATLTLNPPDMGPMQVVLSVTNDQATVTFSAAQPEVRQALQDAMPKLREMMGENGIALGNASVHDGSAGQQQAQQGEPGRSGGAQGHGQVASGSASEAQARVDARPVRAGETPGLVDTFA